MRRLATFCTEEKLIPSSGFLASVIERVRQEAAMPPPIPFPWKWAVAGFVGRRSLRLGRSRDCPSRPACAQSARAELTHAHSAASFRRVRCSRRVGWLGGAGSGRFAALLAAVAPSGRQRRAAVALLATGSNTPRKNTIRVARSVRARFSRAVKVAIGVGL